MKNSAQVLTLQGAKDQPVSFSTRTEQQEEQHSPQELFTKVLE